MTSNSHSHFILFILLTTTFIFLVSTLVTAGLAGLLTLLGDAVAATIVGWVAISLGVLLAVSLISLVLISATILYLEKDQEK